jgi:hypothetical protein
MLSLKHKLGHLGLPKAKTYLGVVIILKGLIVLHLQFLSAQVLII